METVEIALPSGATVRAPVADDVRLLIPYYWMEQALVAHGVSFTPGMRVVEAGAHVGLFPRWLHERLDGDVHYVGLEPWADLAAVARQNLSGLAQASVLPVGLGVEGQGPLIVHPAFPLWSGVDAAHADARHAALVASLPALRDHGLQVLRESGARGRMAWHAMRMVPERLWRPPLVEAMERWAQRMPVQARWQTLASVLEQERLVGVDLLRLDTAGATLHALAACDGALVGVGAVLVAVDEGESVAAEVARRLEHAGFRCQRWPEKVAGRTFAEVGVAGFAPWSVYGVSRG